MVHVFLCSFLAACGGNNPSQGDDDGGPDAPSGQLDAKACTPFAASFASAATSCGTPLPAGGQAQFEGFCKKGVTAAEMCGGNPAGGLECFRTEEPTDWTCQSGDVFPVCNGDLAAALGALCIVALGNPRCASGIHCEFDADCSGNGCNDRTKQCFDKTAYCIGLPCTFDADCPTNEMCNSAEHACVGR